MYRFGPNAGQPVLVEIGNDTQTFSPTPSAATYGMEFVLDHAERTIKLYPPSPTSPASLDASNGDHRRLGIGLLELTLLSDEPAVADGADVSPSRTQSATDREDAAIWEGVFSKRIRGASKAPTNKRNMPALWSCCR